MYHLLSHCWKRIQRKSKARLRYSERSPARTRLQVRSLEPRCTPSTIAHTYTVNDGAQLMAAVQTADNQSGTSEIILNTPGTYSLTAPLNIHANIILTSANINSPQSYIIAPATGVQNRLINITGSNSITVEGLTLQGGSTTGNGGAINATAAGTGLSLYQTIVQNNAATGDGGALFMSNGAALNLVNTTFHNNSAAGSGGAVAFQGSQAAAIVVNHTTFDTNTAGSMGSTTSDGGGMLVQGVVSSGSPLATGNPSQGITLTLTYSNFLNNSSTQDGGGLWASEVATVAAGTITATGNTAVQDAGGLGDSVTRLNSATFALANSTISGNQVTGPGTGSTPDAGGVCFDFKTSGATGAVTAFVGNNTFTNNSVVGAGGGMFLRDQTNGTVFTATVSLNSFSGNSATYTAVGTEGGEGGGLYLDGSGTISTVHSMRNTFTGNTADINGGGLYLTASGRASTLATLTADTFTNNTAGSSHATVGPDTNEGDGGGMMAEAVVPSGTPANSVPPALRLIVTYSSFLNNSATNEGGGLWASDVTGLAAGTITATGNTSVQDAGGLGDSVSKLNHAAFALANSTISSNQVTGPAVGTTPDAGGVCFDFTTANANGAVTALVANNTLANNSVAGAGGGMFLRDEASNTAFAATVVDNAVSNNTASANSVGTEGGEGGGMYVRASGSSNTVALTFNRFSNNDAATNGGGLFFRFDTGTATVSSNTINDNRAGTDGGGMYLTGNTTGGLASTVNLFTDTWTDNHAGTDGGGLYIDANVLAHLMSDSITYNSAGTAGGGVFNNDGTVTVMDSIIMDNTAPTGPNFEGPYADQGGNTIG
ncbi:MAG TPA: hypothetical protein VFA18_17820 [Gemmataceae bacterium]|nr:hypothetical protein [Gemmataceae bacterium]